MIDFRTLAGNQREIMIRRRRDFHRHPETAFEEVRSAGIVAGILSDLGLEVTTGVGKTGVVAILEGATDGPTVMLRCDMDALPVHELNEVEYVSESPGKMHACGHDGHMTIALAVAEMFAAHQDQIQGRIKFIFQPAEEVGLGAQAMMSDGILRDPAPDVVLGLHLWNELSHGELAVTPGPMMAGATNFHVTVKGRGGHAALPHVTHDPVFTMASMITNLQSVVSRSLSPLETAVLSVTQIETAGAINVIPDEVSFHGTLRTFDSQVTDLALERMHSILTGISDMMNCVTEVQTEQLAIPVINDGEIAARLRSTFESAFPDLRYREDFQVMASEDVAYLLQEVPGVYFFVGSGNTAKGLDYPHHHPRFDFDEEALITGAALLAEAAAGYVMKNRNHG